MTLPLPIYFHEVGHAVCAYLLGAWVDRVSIRNPQSADDGNTSYGFTSTQPDPAALVSIWLAGALAECLFRPSGNPSTDFAKAAELADEATLNQLLLGTMELLGQFKDEIHALALELKGGRVLTQHDLMGLLGPSTVRRIDYRYVVEQGPRTRRFI